MKEFDYIRAHKELAMPAFKCLPKNIRMLVKRVNNEAKDLHQQDDLLMPWPEHDGTYHNTLMNALDEIPCEFLAEASRIVYFFGHWSPSRHFQKYGTCWKFSNYADQVLRRKCDVPYYKGNHPYGFSMAIHQGFIRMCYSHPQSWFWEEICLATPRNVELVRGHIEHYQMYYELSKSMLEIREELTAKYSGYIKEFFDTSKYMVESNYL